MCGIAGVLELEAGRAPTRDGLRRMAAVLSHRGPDDEGSYVSGGVALAFRERRRHKAPILGSPRVPLAVLPPSYSADNEDSKGFRRRTGRRQGRSRPERTGHRRPKRLNYAQAPLAAA